MVNVRLGPLRVPDNEPLTERPVFVSRPAIGPLTELPDCVSAKVAVPGPLESDRLPDHLPLRFNVDVVVVVGELGLSLPQAAAQSRLAKSPARRRRIVDSFWVERNPESIDAPPPGSQVENSVIQNRLKVNEIRGNMILETNDV